ncbi:outer membrane protein [Oricola sp.]|uniref:outer membrane protein n=1 Tax=Oricola sp. TaxID=1979950 RepID=UPI003BA9C792
MRVLKLAPAIGLALGAQAFAAAHADDHMSSSGSETPFGGWYIGAEVAHSLANNKLGVHSPEEGMVNFNGWGADGFSAGGFIGYDHLLDNGFLIGGQIGASVSDISSQILVSLPGPEGEFFEGELKTDWFATASARAGYLTNPETLLFGSLGVTVAHGVGSYHYMDPEARIDESDSEREFFYGVAFGTVGVETVLSGNVRGRFEYVASYLNTQTFNFEEAALDVTPIIGSAKVSLIYGFGEPSRVPHSYAHAPASWTGFFGGVKAGHDMANTDLSVMEEGGQFAFDGFGAHGVMAGAFVGYNQQIGEKIVVGVEVGASATTLKHEIDFGTGGPEGFIRVGAETSINARLRGGVLVNPSTLIYGYGGVAQNRLFIEADFEGDIGETVDIDVVEFGGGVETFVSDRVSVRGEYGISIGENLFSAIGETPVPGDSVSLKPMGATGSVSAVVHF